MQRELDVVDFSEFVLSRRTSMILLCLKSAMKWKKKKSFLKDFINWLCHWQCMHTDIAPILVPWTTWFKFTWTNGFLFRNGYIPELSDADVLWIRVWNRLPTYLLRQVNVLLNQYHNLKFKKMNFFLENAYTKKHDLCLVASCVY